MLQAPGRNRTEEVQCVFIIRAWTRESPVSTQGGDHWTRQQLQHNCVWLYCEFQSEIQASSIEEQRHVHCSDGRAERRPVGSRGCYYCSLGQLREEKAWQWVHRKQKLADIIQQYEHWDMVFSTLSCKIKSRWTGYPSSPELMPSLSSHCSIHTEGSFALQHPEQLIMPLTCFGACRDSLMPREQLTWHSSSLYHLLLNLAPPAFSTYCLCVPSCTCILARCNCCLLHNHFSSLFSSCLFFLLFLKCPTFHLCMLLFFSWFWSPGAMTLPFLISPLFAPPLDLHSRESFLSQHTSPSTSYRTGLVRFLFHMLYLICSLKAGVRDSLLYPLWV